ncbi:MAG: terpene cyclase/mutase family protein [Phycisphaerales bacterium]|nr:terpene cyclase/mutase family protein [Phycisphaerales bacterium]
MQTTAIFLALFIQSAPASSPSASRQIAHPDRAELLRTAITALVGMQERDGDWPYEGVYRVRGEIPIGYRVGGTAIVAEALLLAAPDDASARKAIDRGVEFILGQLDDPLMAASTRDTYDVRVWGHCYALEFFCRLREAKRLGDDAARIESWISRLVTILVEQQLRDGGWNYANRRQHASFVTAPVVQALLLARAQGEKVPDEVLAKARRALSRSRYENGAFAYSGLSPVGRPAATTGAASQPAASQPASTQAGSAPAASGPAGRVALAIEGSIARSAICETTLALLGEDRPAEIADALEAFHAHWEWLEKRRKQTGTHVPPFQIAPYYFYYGHRYAAQAIELLPTGRRDAERKRLLEVILRTRDADGTWNDRVFSPSRNFGTAMVVLALLGPECPLPPRFEK